MITLWSFQVLKLYFVSAHLKKIYRKNSDFKKISIMCFWPCPVDRTVDRSQSRTALSVDRAVDRHAPMCMCAHRSTGRKSRALCLFRSTGSVDRQRVFTLCLGTPVDRFPKVGNPTVGRRPARSTDSRQCLLTSCQRLYFSLSFVGASPNESIGLSNPVFIPYK